MSLTNAERRHKIASLGPEELGRRYGLRTVRRLNALAAAKDPRLMPEDVSDDDWVDLVGFDGDQLTNDEFFRMILAALDAAHDHRGALWCIADGPMDHLVGRDASFALRFHQFRRDRATVDGAFDVMQENLESAGLEPGWWADDYS